MRRGAGPDFAFTKCTCCIYALASVRSASTPPIQMSFSINRNRAERRHASWSKAHKVGLKTMRLGIRNSVRLVEALCDLACRRRQPLCINSTTVERLRLLLLGHAQWKSIIVALGKKGIDCFFLEESSYLICRRGAVLISPAAVEKSSGLSRTPKNYRRRSVISATMSLSSDGDILEGELNILQLAAVIVTGTAAVALQDCATNAARRIADLHGPAASGT